MNANANNVVAGRNIHPTKAKVYMIADHVSLKNDGKRPAVKHHSQFFTTLEAADLLRQKPRTITAWAAAYKESGGKNGIQGVKFGRRWLFDANNLRIFIDTRSDSAISAGNSESYVKKTAVYS